MKLLEIKSMLEGISPWPWLYADMIIFDKGNPTGSKNVLRDHDNYQFIAKSPEIISQLVKMVEVMKEALAFYADRDAYNQTVKVWEDMWADSGSKARAALKEMENME